MLARAQVKFISRYDLQSIMNAMLVGLTLANRAGNVSRLVNGKVLANGVCQEAKGNAESSRLLYFGGSRP